MQLRHKRAIFVHTDRTEPKLVRFVRERGGPRPVPRDHCSHGKSIAGRASLLRRIPRRLCPDFGSIPDPGTRISFPSLLHSIHAALAPTSLRTRGPAFEVVPARCSDEASAVPGARRVDKTTPRPRLTAGRNGTRSVAFFPGRAAEGASS
jgi:hypothetical protein